MDCANLMVPSVCDQDELYSTSNINDGAIHLCAKRPIRINCTRFSGGRIVFFVHTNHFQAFDGEAAKTFWSCQVEKIPSHSPSIVLFYTL